MHADMPTWLAANPRVRGAGLCLFLFLFAQALAGGCVECAHGEHSRQPLLLINNGGYTIERGYLGKTDDAPGPVIRSSNKGAELDYGPRGPQSRDGAPLRPT